MISQDVSLPLLFQFESEIQGLFPHLFPHLKHRLQDPTLTPYTPFSVETKALKPQDPCDEMFAKVTNKQSLFEVTLRSC